MNAIFNTCGVILHEGRIGGLTAVYKKEIVLQTIKFRNAQQHQISLLIIQARSICSTRIYFNIHKVYPGVFYEYIVGTT